MEDEDRKEQIAEAVDEYEGDKKNLIAKLTLAATQYDEAGNAEMRDYVLGIKNKIEVVRKSSERSRQAEVKRRKAAKQARKTTRKL